MSDPKVTDPDYLKWLEKSKVSIPIRFRRPQHLNLDAKIYYNHNLKFFLDISRDDAMLRLRIPIR